jgi:hypothetical protein
MQKAADSFDHPPLSVYCYLPLLRTLLLRVGFSLLDCRPPDLRDARFLDDVAAFLVMT